MCSGKGRFARSALRGARVVAVDLDDEKLEVARAMGATYTLNSRKEEIHPFLQACTSGTGPDVVIEAVGSPATYVTAVEEVAFTGRIVYIGYAKSDVSFQTKLFVQKELDIRGSRNALPADFQAAIRYLRHGTCPVERLISAVAPLGQGGEMLARWAADPSKIFRILMQIEP